MKNDEIRALTLDELKEKLNSEQDGLRKLRFAHQVSAIENPMKIKETRRLVARLKTDLKAREIQSK
jgi:large subunit ribosomal protein L29